MSASASARRTLGYAVGWDPGSTPTSGATQGGGTDGGSSPTGGSSLPGGDDGPGTFSTADDGNSGQSSDDGGADSSRGYGSRGATGSGTLSGALSLALLLPRRRGLTCGRTARR